MEGVGEGVKGFEEGLLCELGGNFIGIFFGDVKLVVLHLDISVEGHCGIDFR